METDALRFRLLRSRAMVAISKMSAHYSHWGPFYGNPFDTPELQEYDKNAWKTEGNSNVLVFGGQRRLGGPNASNALTSWRLQPSLCRLPLSDDSFRIIGPDIDKPVLIFLRITYLCVKFRTDEI